MQWQADPNSPLEAYEICYPPYQDGRYENLLEEIGFLRSHHSLISIIFSSKKTYLSKRK